MTIESQETYSVKQLPISRHHEVPHKEKPKEIKVTALNGLI